MPSLIQVPTTPPPAPVPGYTAAYALFSSGRVKLPAAVLQPTLRYYTAPAAGPRPGPGPGPSARLGWWASIRARPFVHLATFGAVHTLSGWVLLAPVFYFFQSTHSANALLGGPQTAWLLSRNVGSKNVEQIIEDQVHRVLWFTGSVKLGTVRDLFAAYVVVKVRARLSYSTYA